MPVSAKLSSRYQAHYSTGCRLHRASHVVHGVGVELRMGQGRRNPTRKQGCTQNIQVLRTFKKRQGWVLA